MVTVKISMTAEGAYYDQNGNEGFLEVRRLKPETKQDIKTMVRKTVENACKEIPAEIAMINRIELHESTRTSILKTVSVDFAVQMRVNGRVVIENFNTTFSYAF